MEVDVVPERRSALPLVTFSVEFSREGLLDLRRRLDDLLGDGSAGARAGDRADAEELSADKVRGVWERLGETSRRYLVAAATFDGEFTVDDLVVAMNLPPDAAGKVKAYHRNVARSAAQVEPVELPVLESRRDGSRTKLRMIRPVRDVVQSLAEALR